MALLFLNLSLFANDKNLAKNLNDKIKSVQEYFTLANFAFEKHDWKNTISYSKIIIQKYPQSSFTKEVLFYLSKDIDAEETAVWLNSEFFSQAFATLFDMAVN